MRSKGLLSILLAVILLLGGCSNNVKVPVERRQNIENDKIKFYNFEWLTELNDILNTFNKDFGKDTYEYRVVKWTNSKNDNLQVYMCDFTGKNDTALSWKIAGHELRQLRLGLISNDDGKHLFLYMGMYLFKDSVLEDIGEKLSKLYNTYDSINQEFYDLNNNKVILISTSKIEYLCDEVNNILENDTTGL